VTVAVKDGWKGRCFEDCAVGDFYRSRIGRTVTDVDNTWFTLLTNNTNQIHFNTEYARRTQFQRPLANSLLTLAIVTGLGVTDVSENASRSAGMRSRCLTRCLPETRCTRNRKCRRSANPGRARSTGS